MKTKTLGELSPGEIRKLVSDKYSEVAFDPSSKYRFRVGQQYALDVGYSKKQIEALPGALAEAFTGVSSYLTHCQEFKAGDVVLELGSGGGLDTSLIARKVGPSGKVIGLDLSFAMLQRAARVSTQAQPSSVYPVPQNAPHVSAGTNILNFPEGRRPKATDVSPWYGVYFCQAEAEEIPLRSDSVDWVVSNGIFNLSPEKERILREIHRVLKPKGRLICSEIVLQRDPSEEERLNEDDWFK